MTNKNDKQAALNALIFPDPSKEESWSWHDEYGFWYIEMPDTEIRTSRGDFTHGVGDIGFKPWELFCAALIEPQPVNFRGVGDWIEGTFFDGCPKEIIGKKMELKYRDGKTVIVTAMNAPDWYRGGKDDYDIVAYRHTEKVAPQPVVDLEGLKREIDDTDSEWMTVRKLGWNNCIDHLASTGRINGGEQVAALKAAVLDLDAEVSRRQRQIENELRHVMPNIGESGSPAQQKHAAIIANTKEG